MSPGTRPARSGPPEPCSVAPRLPPPTPWSAGTISVAHATVLAHGTHDLPNHLTVEAEPVLLEAAGRLDPPGPLQAA
jgi:hypothetical protein